MPFVVPRQGPQLEEKYEIGLLVCYMKYIITTLQDEKRCYGEKVEPREHTPTISTVQLYSHIKYKIADQATSIHYNNFSIHNLILLS